VPHGQGVQRGQVLGGLGAASMVATNRSWPGTSTNATVAPEGSAVQANPRSMVMPRRRSSAHRSGSVPVSARTSVDLP
jgi:hypothetical protein